MPKALLIATAVMAVTVAGAPLAHAGFIGDTLNGSYFFPDKTTVFQNGGVSTVPASFSFATGFPNTTVTVTDTVITQTFDAGGGSYTAASFNGAVITDLSSSDILGVTIDAATSLAGFDASRLSFTSNSVSINIQGLAVPDASNQIVLDVTFGTVPEPASLALLGSALVGLGLIRRRG